MLVLMLLAALLAPADPIRVYVALPESGGFIAASKDLAESQRNLAHEINSRKGIRTVAKREDADIVVTVLRREVDSERDGGGVIVPLGPVTSVRPTYASSGTLIVRFEAGDYSRELAGTMGWRPDVWQECAELVSRDVETWAAANRDRLLAKRTAH